MVGQFLHISLGLNSLPGSCVIHTYQALEQCSIYNYALIFQLETTTESAAESNQFNIICDVIAFTKQDLINLVVANEAVDMKVDNLIPDRSRCSLACSRESRRWLK